MVNTLDQPHGEDSISGYKILGLVAEMDEFLQPLLVDRICSDQGLPLFTGGGEGGDHFQLEQIVEAASPLLPSDPLLSHTHTHTWSLFQARNHVLARWRADVTAWLPEEAVVEDVPNRMRSYARLAWRWLTATGSINTGVSAAIRRHDKEITADSKTVVVVGAGLSGESGAELWGGDVVGSACREQFMVSGGG